MKIFTAHTDELDDPFLAASEILKQIPKDSLESQNTGLLFADPEFAKNGIVSAICQTLGFNVVGTSTTTTGTLGQNGPLQLSLMVFSSENLEFSTFLSQPIRSSETYSSQIALSAVSEDLRNMHKRAENLLGQPPSLILPFLPKTMDFDYNDLFATLNQLNIPMFGSIATSHYQSDQKLPLIYFNGQTYDDRAAFVFATVKKTNFLVSSINDEHIIRQKAIITRSKDNILMEINDIPALSYLEGLGLGLNNHQVGLNSIPLFLNSGDKPEARQFFEVTSEGHLVFNARMNEGLTISTGLPEQESVKSSAKNLAKEISEISEKKAVLIFSGLSRQLTLTWEEMAEINIFNSTLSAAGLPWLLAYSGGEICPKKIGPDESNKLYNLSISACIF